MKVLLLKDVAGVGQKNDVVEAKDGYARNFLLPKKIAVAYAGQAIKVKESLVKDKEEHLAKLKSDAGKLKNENLQFMVKVGDKGEVFGGVNAEMIEARIKELGMSGGKADLKSSLKELGEHEVEINFGSGIKGKAIVELVKEQ